jgi:quinol monooxygenase YgiN
VTAAEPTALPLPLPTTLEGFASCDECDLDVVVPWTGPAIDPETNELAGPLPEGYLVATSGGWPRPGVEQIATDLNHVLLQQLWVSPGLLGATFAISPRCWNSSRALSVWTDDASLERFLKSDKHREAVRKTNGLAYAWEGARWTRADRESLPTWDEVRTQLAARRRDRPVRLEPPRVRRTA